MAAMNLRQQKKRTRHRIAAYNFLSNISLDGTHRDTKYAMFNKPSDSGPEGKENVAGHSTASTSGEAATASNNDRAINIIVNKTTAQSRVGGGSPSSQQHPPYMGHHLGCLHGSIKAKSAELKPDPDFIEEGHPHGLRKQYSMGDSRREDGHLTDKEYLQNITPTKRWRASSYSGDSDKVLKRKILSFTSEATAAIPGMKGIKESIERLAERASRQSYSLSSSSSEGVVKETREIQFITPHKKRIIKDERVLLVSQSKVPLAIYSVIPYSKTNQQGSKPELYYEDLRLRHSSGQRVSTCNYDTFNLETIEKVEGQDISYSRFLVPTSQQSIMWKTHTELPSAVALGAGFTGLCPEPPSGREVLRSISHDSQRVSSVPPLETDPINFIRSVVEEDELKYEPYLLDDPELQAGSYRTLLTFPSYRTSIIDYVKPSSLKKELNEKFRDRFPHIQLTLSKLRSLKKQMKQIAFVKCSADLWIVAQAYVFFEKLILKHYINKQNRKLCAGACLLLSAKLNDVKGLDVAKLIQQMEDDFRLHRKELLALEFTCLVKLEFSLHSPDMEVYPHYQRLLYNS